jgi:hypothetical protein
MVVVRERLHLENPEHLTGNLVLMQVQDKAARVLLELYAGGPDRTLRLFSPPRGLSPKGFNVSSGVGVATASAKREVELRLTRSKVSLVVGGRVLARVDGLSGPAPGARLRVRVGIDHYDGPTGGAPVRAVHEGLVVAARS